MTRTTSLISPYISDLSSQASRGMRIRVRATTALRQP